MLEHLELIWFGLLGVLMAGYAILDGFDLGVGIIHPFIRDVERRNVAIKAIGPLWDGNEVWLVTFGGALFAAFPEAYATLLSAMYLPLMLLLFSLILRAISVDFRNKVDSDNWKRLFDGGFFVSSLLATFIFGVAAGNILIGFPLDERGEPLNSTWDLVSLYSVATGMLAICAFALHGIMFLYLKSTGSVREQLSKWVWPAWGVFQVMYILVSIMTLIEHPHVIESVRGAPWAIPVVVLNVIAIANIPRAIYRNQFAWAFVSSCVCIVCLVALFGISIFPSLVYSTSEAASLTIESSASSAGTLKLMSVIAMIGVPFIVAYTVIIYWTFRNPIEAAE